MKPRFRIEVLKPSGEVAFVRFVEAQSLTIAKAIVRKEVKIRGDATTRWPEGANR